MAGIPTLGRIVHYTMDADDIAFLKKTGVMGDGSGNAPHEGDVLVGTIVAIFDTMTPMVNLKVKLDGNWPDAWFTSRTQGGPEQPGKWFWPPRV